MKNSSMEQQETTLFLELEKQFDWWVLFMLIVLRWSDCSGLDW